MSSIDRPVRVPSRSEGLVWPPAPGPGASPLEPPGSARWPVLGTGHQRRRVPWTILLAVVASFAGGLAMVRFPPQYVFAALLAPIVAWVIVFRPFLGLLLYTSTFMLRPGEIYPALAPLHIERAIGALAIAGMLLGQHNATRRIVIDRSRPTGLFFLLIAAVMMSVPFAYWREAAVNGWIDFLKLLAWYLLVVHLVDTRRRLRIFFVIFLAWIAYIAFDAFRAYLSGSYHYRMGIERAEGQTNAGGDPNHLAATMAATIPILLMIAFYRGKRWMRLLPAAGLVLLVVNMAVTGSRSGLLGFLAGLIVLWVRSRNRLVTGFVGAAILVAGAIMLPDQYQNRYASIGSKELDGSSQGRIELWGKGLRMAVDRPFTGVGINCFPVANAMTYSPPDEPSFMVSHSLYVQLPAEIGWFGTIAFFWFLIEVLRLNRRTRRELRSAHASWAWESRALQGIAAGTAALLVTGIFGDNLMRHTWYIYAALVVAVARLRAAEREEEALPLIPERAAGPPYRGGG